MELKESSARKRPPVATKPLKSQCSGWQIFGMPLVVTALCIGLLGQSHAGQSTAPTGSSVFRIVSRALAPDEPSSYSGYYVAQFGYTLRSGIRLSSDNGRTWKECPMTPDFTSGLPYGFRRAVIATSLDPSNGRLIAVVNAMDTPGLDPKLHEPSVAQKTYYLRYRVSSDAGKTWLFDEPIVQSGNYSARHPFSGVWVGSNSVYLGDIGCTPIFTKVGKILVPAQTTPLGPDGQLWNPTGGHTYTDVLVLIGAWADDHHIHWQVSRSVGDPKRTTRGLIEPTLVEMPDGRILMVMRGSNGGKADPQHQLPSYKWWAVSENGGRDWSAPQPWTFEGGTPFFSPSSMSRLFRHSSGRCFWVGNLTEQNCQGNLPRWPLVIAELDSKGLQLIRSSLLVLDNLRTEDATHSRVDLSHVAIMEDRENGEVLIIYPRSYNGYKLRDWVTLRVAIR